MQQDNSNKYKFNELVEKSVDFTNMIPFLRTNVDKRLEAMKRKVNRSQSGEREQSGD